MKNICLINIVMCFTYCQLNAQIPANDSTWEIKKLDNFDSLITSNWHNKYPWVGNDGCANNGLEYNHPNNVTFQNGYLRITAEKLSQPLFCNTTNKYYNYRSGVVWSKFTHKYGYFEISAKLPVGYKGYWPAFWLWAADGCVFYNEIDIMELMGCDSESGVVFDNVYHWLDNTCGRGYQAQKLLNLPSLSNEHKYAVEWAPKRMTFYFDDIPVKTFYDSIYTPSHLMPSIINFAIGPPQDQWNNCEPNLNSVFPRYYDVNYLKIYQLKTSCSQSDTICSFNPVTYNYRLKKSISIGGASCTSNINTSSNVALRATDYVLLSEGTTITANGSGYFLADVIPFTD